MPRYTLQDSQTGRTLVVEGDAPPGEEDAAQLFGSPEAATHFKEQDRQRIEAVNPWARYEMPELYAEPRSSLAPVTNIEEIAPAQPKPPRPLSAKAEVLRQIDADSPILSSELRNTLKDLQFHPPPGMQKKEFSDEEIDLIHKRYFAEAEAGAAKAYEPWGWSPLNLVTPEFKPGELAGQPELLQKAVGWNEAILGVPKFLTSAGGLMQLPVFATGIGRVVMGGDMLLSAYEASQELAVEQAKPEKERDHYKVGQLQGAMVANTLFGVSLLGRESARLGKDVVKETFPKLGLDKLSEELTKARSLPSFQSLVDQLKPQFGEKTSAPYERGAKPPGYTPTRSETAGKTGTAAGRDVRSEVDSVLPGKLGVENVPAIRVITPAGAGVVIGRHHDGELLDVRLDNGQTRLFRPEQIESERQRQQTEAITALSTFKGEVTQTEGGKPSVVPGARPTTTVSSAATQPIQGPSTGTAPGASDVSSTTVLADYTVVEVPVKDLRLSKDVPNFKAEADEATGVVVGQQLSGKYERLGTPPIVVWERLNGDKEVITGRHRLDLARRSGEKTIPAQIVREADGFTKEMALTFDAEANIRDGQGSVEDYATYFRNSPQIREETARTRGLLSRAKGEAGWHLGRNAGDDLYALYSAGKIPEAKAVAIARTAPGKADLQGLGIKQALKGRSVAEIENFIKLVGEQTRGQPEQIDLFGRDDTALKQAEAMAARASARQRDLAEQIRAVQSAAKRPDIAAKLGVNVSDPEGVLKRIAELKAQVDRWDNWPLHADLVAQVKGGTAGAQASPGLEQPGGLQFEPAETVAEQKARLAREKQLAETKRKADELIERVNRPLKGGTGDLGQKEFFGQGDLFASPAYGKPEPKVTDPDQFASFNLKSQGSRSIVYLDDTDAAKIAQEPEYYALHEIYSKEGYDRALSFARRLAAHTEARRGDVSFYPSHAAFLKRVALADAEWQRQMTGGTAASPPPQLPGGDVGQPPPPPRPPPAPADDPGFTALPVELPEAVIFARDLLGGIYPKVVKVLRALGGQAAGVFRYRQGEGAKGSIELAAKTADLLTDGEKAELRAQAEEYARQHAEPGDNPEHLVNERYKFLEGQAYDEAKKRAPLQALKVLWHEIGHAVDWLPDKIIHGRGNLFGRIASLKNYLKHVIALDPDKPAGKSPTAAERAQLLREAERLMKEELGPMREIVRTIVSEEPEYQIVGVKAEDVKNLFGMDARETMPELYRWFAEQSAQVKKEIVKAAMKGLVDERLVAIGKREQVGTRTVTRTVRERVGREPTPQEIQNRFRQLLREEIRRRNLAELSAVRKELEGAIAWWRGTNKTPDYFKTGTEMFAEAFSIFMNNPAALQARAPTYARLLWNYLDRKPEVKTLYDQVQSDIQTGVVHQKRVAELLRSFHEDDRASLQRDRERLTRGDVLDNVRYHVDRRFGPIFEAVKGSEFEGPVQEAIGNFLYRQSEHELFLNRMNNQVGGPLSRGNMNWDHLGEYMFHQRVVNERFKIFNPLGWNPKNSLERLEEMKQQLGDVRFAALEEAQRNFRSLYEQHVVEPMRASGMFTEELMKRVDDNVWYATFTVRQGVLDAGIERLLVLQFGHDVGAHIFRQVGTVREIKNPATATVLKALSLMSAIARNDAKRVTMDALKPDGGNLDPLNVKRADRKWNGRYQEWIVREGPGFGTVVVMRKGQPEAYYVRKVVADALNKSTSIENILTQQAVHAVGWLKGLYTQLNYGFWPFNFVRDTAAWWMQMPGIGTPIAWTSRVQRAFLAARASVKGRPNAAAEAALRRRMIISRADPRGTWAAAENQYEARLASYGLDPVSWKTEADKVHTAVKAWNWYRELGQTIERTNKIAGMLYLDERFPQMPEWKKAQIVRERAGSPDFLQRGASNPYIDFFAMFYNPWKEAIRSVSRSARENPWSFAAKTTAFVITPTVLQALASSGALGDDVKKQYASIPDYDLTNYLNVPIGWENKELGRVAYWRLPLWEPARVLHGILWQWLTGRGRGVSQFYAGTLPSINSLLDTVLAWKEFELAGHNPYDSFTGKNWLSEKEFAAGGWDARKQMLKRTWNNFGGGLFGRFRNDQLNSPPESEVMKFIGLPLINNALGRWVKVSDRGLADADRRLSIQPDAQRRAEVQLAADEVMRKMLSGEQLTAAERQFMRDPYALQYVAEKLPKVMVERQNPLYRRMQAATTTPARISILQRAIESQTNAPVRLPAR